MWWRDAVLYQVYVRSFADSDGDGVGDLPGVLGKLDHLAWLGVDALWLSPVTPSPDADWGYDVSGCKAIQPAFGTMEDFDRLVSEADVRGIKVVCDLVPNHTSSDHPWFADARSSRDSRYRDWYVWADPAPGGGPPNNWVSAFFGPAWTLDEPTGQYYLHNFLPAQPDLNWWNPEVREAFEGILRFWFDRGVAGFRIDVCHMIVKDRELRDNPPATDDDHLEDRLRGQRMVYNANRPEAHDVLRDFRRVADGYDPPRLLLGETYFFDLDRLARFHGQDDELHLAFNFPFVFSELEAGPMREVVAATERTLAPFAWPVWTGSNHDAGRFPTRWCGGDPDLVRCALVMLLTLRGTPVLYYGDEIGLPDTEIAREQVRDPVGERFWPVYKGRDPGRTPMHWSAKPGAGFTAAGAEPWLPLGDHGSCNVAGQRDDPTSVLHLCRDLIALRRSRPELRSGDYTELSAPEGVWAYRRGEGTAVVLNLSGTAQTVEGISGRVLIATDRARDGEDVSGAVELGGSHGLVLALR